MASDITFCFYTILYDKATVHLSFDRQKHLKALSYLEKNYPAEKCKALLKEFTEKNLRDFLTGSKQLLPPAGYNPFIDQGTGFQRRVWLLISDIPYGETRTYGDLALALGSAALARAVGRACNANPLALFIPCHRVTAKNSAGGFSGGRAIKKRLLELEATY